MIRRLTEPTRVRQAIARHEARHVLAALIYGVPTLGVEIDTKGLGRTHLGVASINREALAERFIAGGGIETTPSRPLAIAVITTLLVGYMETDPQVGKWFPDLPDGREAAKHWPPSAFDGWSEATEQLGARMGHLRITDLEYDEALINAQRFILECQAAIGAVATALLERHALTQDEVATIAAPILSDAVIAQAEEITGKAGP